MKKAVLCQKTDQPSLCSVRRLKYMKFVLQAKNAANEAMTAWCVHTLLLDEVAPEDHHNDWSYVHKLNSKYEL